MPYPRVLVITSCTGEKRFKPEKQLTIEDFKDEARLIDREVELGDYACPASEMYTGMQHLRLMEGVQKLRDALGHKALDVSILSAGYGVISERQVIVPYEVTFNGMKSREVDTWAIHLGVHDAIASLIPAYDLIFFLLGDNYLRAVTLPLASRVDQTFVFLASRGQADGIQGMAAKTYVMPLSNPEAKRYRYGMVGLKGFLFKQFAEVVASQPTLLKEVYETPQTFQTLIDQQTAENQTIQLAMAEVFQQVPSTPRKRKSISKKTTVKKDDLLTIPDVPPAPNQHLGTQYFIPEWDDRVYPKYNFLTEKVPEDRDPYKDDVYAHEMYPQPNYNGILISKIVIDSSQTKRERFEKVGVHNFVRFSGDIMGDCGAFGYVKEDEPPYETDEILDYYERLGFNYGVSIDHLIFGPFAVPGIREKRYNLTLKNAEDFLVRHKAQQYNFKPIGVAQGWSPETYADSVKALIQMGYDFIAIGGLARAQNREIIPVLKAIHPHVDPHVRIHLFGVARVEAVPLFQHLGITSFDSAGPLRQAWLSSDKNYHTLTGKHYMAIRVPPVTGNRAKKVLDAGHYDCETLERLEQDALAALREYDAGRLGIEATLEAAATYNEALDLSEDEDKPEKLEKLRAKRRQKYLETLTDKPWKACACEICEQVGIEVAIFRNNNRNRRRGFHNTYVFYKRLADLL
ncbi:queuine/archaeosine tRNA-ribosyltransferase [Nodosilinea sp. LEGE 07298]|uniref:tRNA-guanine transglycosylase DpdA n=1 Tax=Nodosilinea sp. LEGE 07298 TaxID=2777970 RepID=UPI00187F638C|nr:tRNA-guanine transglycosylase DpdA [Nodosilinea sp. LEGE 07298]MBE9110592.1 queuine/archaeosine tRNA-ribosyltransferase [Nodosilinea sp. LEGE 07298]